MLVITSRNIVDRERGRGDGGRHRRGPSSVQPEELREEGQVRVRQQLRRSNLSSAKRGEKSEAATEEVHSQFSREGREEEGRH